MKISDNEYRGFKYEIHFIDKGDWGQCIHHFHTKCDHNFDSGFHKTYEDAQSAIEAQIDQFFSNSPKTLDELVVALDDCLVWSGYEQCELDHEAAKVLIKTFMEHQK